MQIVIDIPEEYYNLLKGFVAEKCSMDMLLLKNGTPLPEGVEILTKEAYSDLCMRAADVTVTNVGYMDCIKGSTTDSTTTDSDSSTVEPERKTGRWVNVDGTTNSADCSCCKNRGRAWMNYCYICGAKMEVSK